jgi:hypothetical protein
VWFLTDPDGFQRRLLAAAQAAKLDLRHDLVRYVDFDAVHGSIPRNQRAFVKSTDYADEREFRIAITAQTPLADPFTLNTGNLAEVSMLMPLDEFMSNVEIVFPSAEDETENDLD